MPDTKANRHYHHHHQNRKNDFDSLGSQRSSSSSSHHKQYIIVIEDNQPSQSDVDVYETLPSPFEDRSRRNLFTRKILSIVGLQLLFCSGLISVALYVQKVSEFFRSDPGAYLGFGCSAIFLMTYIMVGCCGVGRGKPNACNISLLIVATVTLSLFTTVVTVDYDIPSILIATATTVGTVTFLLFITVFTKCDITDKIWYIIGGFFALFLFSIITTILALCDVITVKEYGILKVVICAIVALLFAILILYELKMIVGGGKYEYTEEDWLIASLSLFYNIVMFFVKILQLFTAARNS